MSGERVLIVIPFLFNHQIQCTASGQILDMTMKYKTLAFQKFSLYQYTTNTTFRLPPVKASPCSLLRATPWFIDRRNNPAISSKCICGEALETWLAPIVEATDSSWFYWLQLPLPLTFSSSLSFCWQAPRRKKQVFFLLSFQPGGLEVEHLKLRSLEVDDFQRPLS